MKAPTHYPHLAGAFASFLDLCKDRKVTVFGHARPDADCVGSQVALVRVLRARGIAATAYNESPLPFRLTFLTEGVPFVGECREIPADSLLVTVDCSDTARLGEVGPLPEEGVMINFDHHLSNPDFGYLNFVVKDATSTAEVLAGLFFDAELPVDRATATALYAGIITDAGNFCYPSTTPEVLELAAKLIRCGAEPAAIAQAIYERETFAKMRLLTCFLGRLTLLAKGRACYSWLTAEDFARTGATYQDTEGLVNHARSIEGVQVAAYLEVRDGTVKGSLRAREASYRVDLLAGRFGGGGHACAAGFTWEGALEDLLPLFQNVLEETCAS